MLKRITFIFLVLFVFNSCCNKSACNTDQTILPVISITFTNVTNSSSSYKIYTLYKGTVIDSAFQYSYYSFFIKPYRFINDPVVADKKFVVIHNSKSDTISNVSCSFYSEKTYCSSCWPSNDQYTNLWKTNDLTYTCAGKPYTQNQTLTLEY